MFLLVLRRTLIGESPIVVCCIDDDDDDDVNVIRRGWNDGIFASTDVMMILMQQQSATAAISALINDGLIVTLSLPSSIGIAMCRLQNPPTIQYYD